MRTLAFTPSAREARDRYQDLVKRYPQGPLNGDLAPFLKTAGAGLAASFFAGLALHVVLLILTWGPSGPEWPRGVYAGVGIGPLVGAVLYIVFRLVPYITFENARQKYQELLDSGDILKADGWLIERWSERRKAAGLGAFDDRADLENFPEAVSKVIALRVLHNNELVTQEERELIDRKIDLEMDEALVALATEVATARSFDRAAKEAELASDRLLVEQQLRILLDS